jgi:phosphatidylinositol glycan class B
MILDPRDGPDAAWFRRALVLGVVTHVVAAMCSLGWLQFDEHFQILEYLTVKLRGAPPQPGFELGMRSFVQIAPLYAIARGFEAVFGASPIALERVYRLLAAAGGLAVSAGLARRLAAEVEDRFARRAGVLALLAFWPFVFTHARISAECVGSTLFWGGVLVLLEAPAPEPPRPGAPRRHPAADRPSADVRRLVVGGLLLGLACAARLQLGFALAGLGAWLLLVARARGARVAALALGFAGGELVGFVADRWGYGAFTLTPWNYFRENILHGMAQSFGVEPPWWYVPEAALALGGPFGALAVLGVLWFWARRVRHVVALPTVTFVLGHCLIAHKELRFLIPALPAVPFALAHALDEATRANKPKSALALRGVALAYGAAALVALPAMTLRPASLPLYYYAYVDAHFRGGYEVYYDRRAPMSLGPFEVYYYRPASYVPHAAKVADLEARLGADPAPFLFFHDSLDLPESAVLRARCRVLVQTVPSWMQLPALVRAFDPAILWSLHECGGGGPVP